MSTIKSLFPFSFRASTVKELVITILVYLVADFVCGLIIGFLGSLPIVGFIFAIIGWVLGLYFFVGIVLAVLSYLKVLKD